MSERISKPAWVPGWHPQDQNMNSDAIWAAIEVLMPPYPVFTTDLDDAEEFTASASASLTIACASPDHGTLTYHWQKEGSTAWEDVASATSATLTIASWASANEGNYRCKVVNTFNNTTATVYSNVCTCTTAS